MSNLAIKLMAYNMISIMLPLKFLMKLLAVILRTLAHACTYTADAANVHANEAMDVVDYINEKKKQSNEDQDSEFCPDTKGSSWSSKSSSDFPY